MKQPILALLLLPQIIVSGDSQESAPPVQTKQMTSLSQSSEPDEEPQGFVGQVCETVEECANVCLVCIVVVCGLIASGKNKVR